VAIRPIFIFSNPRAGSTLVQRVIAAHDGVATTSEPWLLLPHLYSLREAGLVAEYPHPLAVAALREFCEELPGGEEDYRRELHDFILRVYERAAGSGAGYFLDKTPPYYFIAEEIMELFPEGRFVFLWRNPLSVMASTIETWLGGRWHPTAYSDGMFIGMPRLVSAYLAHRDSAFAVRYEDLVGGGSETNWRALMDYLGIEFEPAALHRFVDVELTGQMGDRSGPEQYSGLSTEPTQKWKRTLANPMRKAWSRRYLRWLGDDRLAVMGYDRSQLISELDALPLSFSGVGSDLARMAQAVVLEPARAVSRRRGPGSPSVLMELAGA
jgi:hypothetical protein